MRRATFREAASVIVNPASGTVTVRATGRQHEKIQEFLESVMAAAKRQVLIEATIVEVALSDGYRQGIDWSRTRAATGSTFGIAGPGLGSSGSRAGDSVHPHVPQQELPAGRQSGGAVSGILRHRAECFRARGCRC